MNSWMFRKLTYPLLVVLATLGPSEECRPGWVEGPSSRCYFFSNFIGTWADANSVCKAIQAKLAEPDDESSFKFLAESEAQKHPTNGQFFIGGSDMFVEGIWLWTSTSQAVSSSHWAPGQPSDDGGNGDCLTMLNGTLNDVTCRAQYPFICEERSSEGEEIFG